MFINELHDEKLIHFAKQYLEEMPNQDQIQELLKEASVIELARGNKQILVNIRGMLGSLLVSLNDHQATAGTGHIISNKGYMNDGVDMSKSHVKNMLKTFDKEYYAMLENAIRTKKVDNIDLQTLNLIVREIQEEQESLGD